MAESTGCIHCDAGNTSLDTAGNHILSCPTCWRHDYRREPCTRQPIVKNRINGMEKTRTYLIEELNRLDKEIIQLITQLNG